MAWICKSCGYKNTTSINVCSRCGETLVRAMLNESSPQITSTNDNRRSNTTMDTQSVQASRLKDNNTLIKILIALGVVVVILLSSLLIISLKGNGSNLNLNSSLSSVSTTETTTATTEITTTLETTQTTIETESTQQSESVEADTVATTTEVVTTVVETTVAQTVPPVEETEPIYYDDSLGHPISSNYVTYYNERFGFTVEYPDNFYADVVATDGGGCIITDGCAYVNMGAYYNIDKYTIEEMYYEELSQIYEPIHYQLLRDDYYIISWFENDNVRYRKVYVDSVITSLDFEYPAEYKCYYDDLINNMVKTIQPATIY